MSDIVERLRSRKEPTIEVDMHYPQIVDSDTPDAECIEAADEITRLRAKVERLEEAVKDLTAECREYCFDECQSNCEPMTACRLFIARAAITKGESHG